MKKSFATLILLLLLFIKLNAQESPKEIGLKAITEEAIKGQLEFLASDWTEGRAVGTKGAFIASDYIASIFKVYGVKPAGDDAWTKVSRKDRWNGKRPEKYRSYFQNIPFIESNACDKQYVSLITNENGVSIRKELENKVDFSMYVGDLSTEFEAPLVFVGYGLKDEKNNYDDFKNIDVKGKIIVRLNGFPGHKDTSSAYYKKFKPKGRWWQWYLNRSKMEEALKQGALGVVEINTDDEPMLNWAQNVPFRYNEEGWEGEQKRKSYYDNRVRLHDDPLTSRVATINLSKRVADELLNGSEIDIKDFEKKAAKTAKTDSKIIKNKKLHVKTCLEAKTIKCRNVLGMIEGKNPDEIIVVGGHYDHLGIHDGFIWNGADDNASGTVGVMTIAKAFMASGVQPEKTIIFAAWTGEEKGLYGSKYFVSKAEKEHGKVILNLNFDMISRDSEKDSLGVKCSMDYTKGYEKLEEWATENNKRYELGLDIKFKPSERPGGGSDHAPFARKDIPIFYFMAGFPMDYHQPTDHVEKVNWDKMLNIIKLGYLNLWEVAHSKEPFLKK